jgi:hypothetical protein
MPEIRDQQGGYSFESLLDQVIFRDVASSSSTYPKEMLCTYNRKAKTAMIRPKYFPDDREYQLKQDFKFASSDRISLGLAGFFFFKRWK